MGGYFRYYFNEPKETITERLHLELNPFGIIVMKHVGGTIIAESDKRLYTFGDAEKQYSDWEFYPEMTSIFHFKAQSRFDSGHIYNTQDLVQRRAFADELDKQKIPYYLLAHTDHDTQVLIRGLTLEHEGIINPKCNTLGVDDSTAHGMIKGLNYREHVFGEDFLAKYLNKNK